MEEHSPLKPGVAERSGIPLLVGLPALRCFQEHGRKSVKGWNVHRCRYSSAHGAALAHPVGPLLGTRCGPQTGHCPRRPLLSCPSYRQHLDASGRLSDVLMLKC